MPANAASDPLAASLATAADMQTFLRDQDVLLASAMRLDWLWRVHRLPANAASDPRANVFSLYRRQSKYLSIHICLLRYLRSRLSPASSPPAIAPPSPPPSSSRLLQRKVCRTQMLTLDDSFCGDRALYSDFVRPRTAHRGWAAIDGPNACRTMCEVNTSCRFFSAWKTGWCLLTATCDAIMPNEITQRVQTFRCSLAMHPPLPDAGSLHPTADTLTSLSDYYACVRTR